MHTTRGPSRPVPIASRDEAWPHLVSEIELSHLRNVLRPAVNAARAAETPLSLTGIDSPSLWRTVTIPSGPIAAAEYYRHLAGEILPGAAPVSSPRCLAHMTSIVPDLLVPIAELVAAINQNMVKRDASRVFTLLERQTIGALHNLVYGQSQPFYDAHVQCDASTLGVVTSGGTASNLTALWIARNLALGPEGSFAGVERAGLAAALAHYGYSRAVIIGSRLLHYSFDKAASVLGLGSDGCVKVPIDDRRRIDVDALVRTLEDCRTRGERVIAIVGIAGATDCGTIDPLASMADVAESFGTTFHVDAAWGGSLLFSGKHAAKVQGIARADSVTFDAHKQMHLPIGSGLLLLRDPHAAVVIEKRAHYMLQEESGDLGTRSLDGSRPCTALLLHAALNLIGSRGYEQSVDQSIERARFMASEIERRNDFELLVAPDMNIVLYRFVPNGWEEAAQRRALTANQNQALNLINSAIQRQQTERAAARVSRTCVDYKSGDVTIPITALRAVVSNPLTTEDDIRHVLDEQTRVAKAICGSIDSRASTTTQ